MKTYRNEKYGFEIDLPDEWAPVSAATIGFARLLAGKNLKREKKEYFQYGGDSEAFNFEIGPLFLEPSLDDTECEFTIYAQDREFKELVFGRIFIGGKEHVCAHYYIDDKLGKRWNKKYMIVFGGVEYTITGTCNNPKWFAQREKEWDIIVSTFHLLVPVYDNINSSEKVERYREKRREIIDQRIEMRESTGVLYTRAYEAVSLGQFKTARVLLEDCLRENPNHVLAHKELGVVLKKLGNIKGAIRHRWEVKRLAPNDLINRANLIELLAACGKRGDALKETRESLLIVPYDPILRSLEKKLLQFQYTDYRLMFFSSLMFLVFTVIGKWTGEMVFNREWIGRLIMLVPIYLMYISGPFVGLPKVISGLMAGVLYFLFMIN